MITCHVAKDPTEIRAICQLAKHLQYYVTGGVLKNWYQHTEYIPVLTYAKEKSILVGVCLFLKYGNKGCLSTFVDSTRRNKGIGTMLISAIMSEIQTEEKIEAENFCYNKAVQFAGKVKVKSVNYSPLIIYPYNRS